MSSTCAVHPGEVATFTCSRCGSFGCAQCAAPDQLCEACDRRRGAVLGHDLSAGGLLGDAFRVVARFVPAVILFALVETAAETAFSYVRLSTFTFTTPDVPNIAGALALALFTIAFKTLVQASWISLLASAARGAPLGPLAALQQGLPAALPLLACNLMAGLAIGLGLMLLIIPGLLIGLGLSLAAPAVVASRRGPVDALGASWSATEGHRVQLLLALVGTGGIAWLATVAVNLSLGAALSFVPAAAPITTAVSSLMGSVLLAPMLTVPVLAWLRITRAT